MSIVDRVLNRGAGADEDYVELDESILEGDVVQSGTVIHVADVRGQQDLLNIKDELYDGNIVIASVRHIESNGLSRGDVVNPLQQVVDDIGGDIVQNNEHQLILTPSDIGVSRETL